MVVQEPLLNKKKKILKKEITLLSARELSESIMQIMKRHIGRNSPISQKDLFKRLFGNPNNYSDLQVWFILERIRKAMNWLRRTSHCFVITRRTKYNIYVYFVVKDYDDAAIYIDHLSKVKKRINFMQHRCLKAIEEKFWEDF